MEVGRQMETLPRAEIVAQSLKDRSGIVITKDLEEAGRPVFGALPTMVLPGWKNVGYLPAVNTVSTAEQR